MPAVLGAILNDWLRRIQKKMQWHTKKTGKVKLFTKLITEMAIQLQVLIVHALPSWLYTLLCVKKKHPQQICHYRHVRNTSCLFLLHNTGISFSSRKNLSNLGSFEKVSIPKGSIIPWLIRHCKVVFEMLLYQIWKKTLPFCFKITKLCSY